MNDSSSATGAEGGRNVVGLCDSSSPTSEERSPDLSKENPSCLPITKCAEELNNVAPCVPLNSAMPNLVPGLQAVLRHLIHGGPTVLSIIKTDIRAGSLPWQMNPGDVDFCLNPDRPDGAQDTLGLAVLDEPAMLPKDNDVLLQYRTCLPSFGDSELANSCGSTIRVESNQTLHQEADAWATAVRAHHRGLATAAKAAGLESTANNMVAHIERPLAPHINCALRRQLLFCISELPMLSLSVENLAKVVCWLGGVPFTQSVHSPLPELLALFSLCLERLPIAFETASNK